MDPRQLCARADGSRPGTDQVAKYFLGVIPAKAGTHLALRGKANGFPFSRE
jgi:hypothetical protein